MAVELLDNATSPGTSTFLTDDIEVPDLVLPVADIASVTLRQPGGQFRVGVINLGTGEMELMLVTANAWTPNWTVQRGIEGTDALNFPQGSLVKHIITAGALENIIGQLAPSLASGIATLVAGTVSVSNLNITANSIVRLSRQAAGGTLGQLSVALTAGTGFAINSSSNTETSKVYYEIVSY
jgi:hypothetical protein